MIHFSEFLPLDGSVFTVNGVKYTIHAKLHHAIYPYKHDYVYLSAEYSDNSGPFGVSRDWFLDLKTSESKTCEKLWARMHKKLATIK